MAKYLVTGVAGFIASRVAEMLLLDGHEVVGIDNMNDYYDVRLKEYRLSHLLGEAALKIGLNRRVSVYTPDLSLSARGSTLSRGGQFTFRHLDIESVEQLASLFSQHRFDAVFNLAARAGVRYSMENPYVYLSTNTLGTINVLECQRRFSVKKLILASTSSLYTDCASPFSETSQVDHPISPYAATKKAAELLSHSYHHLYGLDVSILRYFTVFGPAGRPDMAPLKFLKCIDTEKPITLYGDGSQKRDFTYIDDIADGTIRARKELGYEVINLGGGRSPVSILEMIRIFEKHLGKTAIIEHQPFHKADLKETSADITKAKRLLDWHPSTDPQAGFAEMAQWYCENKTWLSGLEI